MDTVRALWNGKTLLCLPSYITSTMLLKSTSLKYFSTCIDPIEIIEKNRNRGFGVYINKKELEHYVKYCYNDEKLKIKYDLTNSKKITEYKILKHYNNNTSYEYSKTYHVNCINPEGSIIQIIKYFK
jgi:hypothetical protein